MHANFASDRRLKHRFFDEDVMVLTHYSVILYCFGDFVE